jgi:hypothetical protein
MPEWTTIERIALRGGPCDGDRLDGVGTSDLMLVITVPGRSGEVSRYRKTGDYEQLRGADTATPYSRTWFYDWIPDA